MPGYADDDHNRLASSIETYSCRLAAATVLVINLNDMEWRDNPAIAD